jgi:MFS family permease
MNLQAYIIFWLSQFGSILGRGISHYAIMIWIFQIYQSASSIAFGMAAINAIQILVGPFAGFYADRIDRKKLLMLADFGQIIILLLLVISILILDNPPLLLIYTFLLIGATIDTIHYPALISGVSQLVKQKDLVRANSLISFSDSASPLFAPILAAILLSFLSISTLLFLNILSFVFAISVLSFLQFPKFLANGPEKKACLSDLKDTYTFIKTLNGATFLLCINGSLNFFISASFVLIAPLVLKTTNGDAILLGTLMTVGGGAQLLVSLTTAIAPSSKYLVRSNMVAIVFLGIFGVITIGLSRHPLFWGLGLSVFMGIIPFINATNRSIWQSRVPIQMQGRFFAVRRALSKSSIPIAQVIAGIVVDYLIEPKFPTPVGISYNIAIVCFGIFLTFIGMYGIFSSHARKLQYL